MARQIVRAVYENPVQMVSKEAKWINKKITLFIYIYYWLYAGIISK